MEPDQGQTQSAQSVPERSLRNAFLACLRPNLLDRLNFLVQREGAAVSKTILEMTLNREFSYEEADKCWGEINAHSRQMADAMGRPVEFYVVVADYFTQQEKEKGAKFTKIFELDEFENVCLEYQFDHLTGLQNRQAMEKALRNEISRTERYGGKFSLLILDLDSFKVVNDVHGHMGGDKVLRRIGEIFVKNKRTMDIACRYGGDEFVFILPGTSKKEALGLAERISRNVNQQIIKFEGGEVQLGVSGGIAGYPEDGTTADELVACADKVLYQVKCRGGNSIRLYTPENRRADRFPLHTTVAITHIDRRPIKLPDMQAKNMSDTGILIESKVPLNVGSVAEIELSLEGVKLTIQGRVVRTLQIDEGRYDIGLQFLAQEEQTIATPRKEQATGRPQKEEDAANLPDLDFLLS